MADGFSYDINRRYGTSSDHSSGRSSGYQQSRNDDRWSSDDPDDMTLELVNAFKNCIQDKIQQGQQLHQAIIELEIFKIRRNKNPGQFDIDKWKNRLPHEIRTCSDTIVRLSMAYGDDPQELTHVIKAKMSKTTSIDNPCEISLDNIKQPLQRLQRDLDGNAPPNIIQAVRDIDDQHIDRAHRLFLSEAHSFAPGLENYTIDDTRKAVQAIRETTAQINKPEELLTILKTCREVDDIRQYIQKPSKRQDAPPSLPPTTTSSISTDKHRSNIYPSTNNQNDNHRQNTRPGTTDRNQNNTNHSLPHQQAQIPSTKRDESSPARFAGDAHRPPASSMTAIPKLTDNTNPTFYYRPRPNPPEQSSRKSGFSSQGSDTRSRDESDEDAPPRREFDKKN